MRRGQVTEIYSMKKCRLSVTALIALFIWTTPVKAEEVTETSLIKSLKDLAQPTFPKPSMFLSLNLSESSSISDAPSLPSKSENLNFGSSSAHYNRVTMGIGFQPDTGLSGFKFGLGVFIAQERQIKPDTTKSFLSLNGHNSGVFGSIGYKYWRIYSDLILNYSSDSSTEVLDADSNSKVFHQALAPEVDLGVELTKALCLEGFYRAKFFTWETDNQNHTLQSHTSQNREFVEEVVGLRVRFQFL